MSNTRMIGVALAGILLLAGCAVNSSKLASGEKMHVVAGVMEGYQDYIQTKGAGSGAFAVTLAGDGYAYAYCPAERCFGGSSALAPRAIKDCESHGDKCVLFARDGGIIVPYEVVP